MQEVKQKDANQALKQFGFFFTSFFLPFFALIFYNIYKRDDKKILMLDRI